MAENGRQIPVKEGGTAMKKKPAQSAPDVDDEKHQKKPARAAPTDDENQQKKARVVISVTKTKAQLDLSEHDPSKTTTLEDCWDEHAEWRKDVMEDLGDSDNGS